MRQLVRRLGQRGVFVAAAFAAVGLALALAGARAATIQTDLWAYQVGDTVHVTGDGFGAGEAVDFVAYDPFGAVVDMGQASSDADGNVAYDFVLQSDTAGIFTEVATGEVSGETASTAFDPTPNPMGTVTFTDARAAGDGITLNWPAQSGPGDCFYIYRTQTTPASAVAAAPGYLNIGTSPSCSGSPPTGVYAIQTGSTSTSFQDAGVDGSHSYAYAVTEVKASTNGNGGQSPALSNVVRPGMLNSTTPTAFPLTALGSSATGQTITVTNNSGAAFTYHGIETTSEFPVSNVKLSGGATMVANTTTVANGGTFSFTVGFTPSAAGARSATLKVEGYDANQSSTAFDTKSITVTGTGDSPPTCSAVSRSTNEDTAAPVTLSCTDPDAGDTFTYAYTQPAHGTVAGTAPNVTYTPAANYNGADSFTYTATDNHGATTVTPATVSLTVVPVNDAPTATTGPGASTNEDTAKSIDLSALASDLETKPSSALAYAIVGGAAHGVVTVASGGLATYTPTANFHGTDTFTYQVTDTGDPAGCTTASSTCDPTHLSATATVTVTVVPVNDAPTAVNGTATTNEDTQASISLSALASDLETPSANLTYTIVSGTTNGSATLGTGGAVTYTPTANFHGTDSFTYKVTDNGDPAGCTPASSTCDPTAKTSTTQTVSITVAPVNDAPTAGLTSAITNEDTPGSIDLKPYVSDVETAPAAMTYTVTQPGHGSVAPGATNGTFVYTPASNYNGPDSFTYTVTDSGDGSSPALTSAPATVTVSVLPVNDAPVANPGTASADEDTATSIDLTPFAHDVETASSNLTYAIVSGPAHGTATVGAAGTVSYTSALNYHGPDSFTYKVTDTGDPVGSSNTLSSNTATISLTVNAVNDAPVATNATATTAEDTAGTVDLTSHVTDVETAASAMTYTIVDAPTNGTVAPGSPNGTFVYTPTHNFNGTDSFTYTVTDTGDGSSPALTSVKQTVTFTVTPVNDAPVAGNGTGSTDEDTAGTIDLTQFATDVETSPANLTYTIVVGPAHGSADLAGGLVTYTPDPNFNGPDSFTYKVTDTGDPAGSANVLSSATRAISLTVNPVNDAPSAGFASALTNEDTAKTIDLRGEVSDHETAPGAMTYTVSTPPGHGTVTQGATNGTLVYTPDPNYNGGDTFAYTVTDTGDPAGCIGGAPACSAPLTSAPNTVTLTVLPVNDAPVGHDDTVSVATAAGTGFNLATASGLVNDVETANANLTYTIVTGPTQGTLTAGGSAGAFTYVPNGTASGTDTATYKVTDRGDPDACGTVSASCDGVLTSATYTITFALASTIAPPVTDGLQLEFDGDSVAQADGSPVTLWNDGSGNHRDLSAASNAAATLHAGAVNGHNAIEFDGVNSLLKTYGSTFTIAQPDTFYIVYRSADPASDTSRGFVFDSMDSSLRQAFGREDSQTQRMYANIDLDAHDVTFPFAGYEIWSGSFNGTNSSMFENGTQVAAGNSGGSVLQGFTVGGLNSGTTFGFDRGHSYIAELLVYSGAQTDAQRTSITNWLNAKFNAIGSPTPPANTTAPSLSGYPLSGATLTALHGTWTGTVPIHYAYEIRRCDTSGNNCVAVANTQDYVLTAADDGSTIRVAVTATNSVGSATAVSEPTAVITQPVLLANDTPPYTQGLQLWYDANDETYTDGASVRTFHDLSGYGRDLTSFYPDGFDAPTFRASAVNGRPAIEFNGTSSLLKTYGSKFAFKQPNSFFIVYQQLDTREAYIFDSMDSSSRELLGRNAAGDMEMYANNELDATATFPFPKFQVWSGTYADGTSVLDQNGTQVAAGNTGIAPQNGFTLGGLNSGGNFGFNLSHSLVAEVLWYTGTMTAAQRQSVEQYLLNKYGLGKPTATLTAPTTAVQGNSVTISLDDAQTSSSDPLHYAFSCDGTSLAGVTYATAGTSPTTTCTFTDTTVTHTVIARVIDSQDQFTEYNQVIAATTSVPSATFTAPSSVGEGTAIHLSLDDPQDTSTAGAPFTYAFDCGTGLGAFSPSNSADCPTIDDGSAAVGAEIQDAFGNTTSYTATVAITNVAPAVTPAAPQSSSEGSSIDVALGSFVDPGANDGPWHVTVDWGDGSNDAFDAADMGALQSLAHTYSDSGTYHVAVAVTDKDSGAGSATFDVTVADVAPSATLSNDGPVAQGSPATVTFTDATDPSPADVSAGFHFQYACDGGTFGSPTTDAATTCSFVDVGDHVVAARIADQDGQFTAYTTTVHVTNVAPTVTEPADQTATEGSSASFQLGSFVDPGTNDGPWQVTVDWGDGTPTRTLSAAAAGSLGSTDHTYGDANTYTATVTVADAHGASDSRPFSVTVANVAPSVTAPASESASEGDGVFALGSFTDPGAADGDWHVHVDWGDGGTDNFDAAAPGDLGMLTHTYADNGTYDASVTVTDKHTDSGTAHISISVANVAPTATLSNDSPVAEGSPATISFSDQFDPSSVDAGSLTYQYACDGTNYGAATSSPTATCTFADNGSSTVAAKILDKDGGSTSYTTSVTINNVKPTATFTATPEIDEGASATLSLTNIFDPSSADTAAGLGYAFACDGLHFGAAGGSTTTTCAFATPGTYEVAATVSDKDGGSTSYSAQVVVDNVAPSVGAAGPQLATEATAQSFNLGSFTDPGVNDGPWTVTVDWGDSSTATTFTSTPGTLPAQPHTYGAPGIYSATVTVLEAGGAAGSDTFSVNVANVAPSVTAPADQTATEAATKSFALGSFSDRGASDGPWSVTVDWDDGSTETFPATGQGSLGSAPHTYAMPGTYHPRVTVTDHPGLDSSAFFAVTVGDVAPAVTAPADQSTNEDALTSFDLGSFDDPGTADGPWSVTVNWGDGQSETLSADAPGTLDPTTHTYATPGTYHVKVTVADKPGLSDFANFDVTVANVRPSVTAGANQSANEGGSKSFDLGSFDDPGANDGPWHVDVSWGDGTGDSTFSTPSRGSLGSLDHIYASAGSYTVTETVTDSGTLSDTQTFVVDVANVAPTVVIVGAPASSAEGTPLTFGSTVDDPGLADTFSYAWSVTKDGAAYDSGIDSTFEFTPDDNGTYVVTLTVTDKDSGQGVGSQTIDVTNVAPTATISGAATIDEGTATTISLSTPLDPSTADAAAGLRYAFNCDGANTSVDYATAATSPTTSCFYDDGPSDHVVTAAVIDKDGGYTTSTTTVHVDDVKPTATFTAPFSVSEGSSFGLSLSAPHDRSVADSAQFTYAFDCSGGYPLADSLVPTATCAGLPTGTVTVRGRVADKDGATEYTQPVTVVNVAPTPAITGAPAHSPEGTAIPLGSTATDPGNDISTYAWSVTRNGVAFGVGGSGAAFTFTPDDNGSYVVTLSVSDTNGGTGTASATIAVDNVNPVPTITSAPASGSEGTAITVTGSSFDASTVDRTSLVQSWTVKRGTTTVASTTGDHVTFTPGVPGTYAVTLQTTDKDTGTGTTEVDIPVTNVTPSPTITGAPTTTVAEGTSISLGSTTGDPGDGIGDTFTYAWSVTKNSSAFATGSGSGFSFTPNDNGTYVVSLSVTDANGATGTAPQQTITVTNVAPTATFSASSPVNEGSSISLAVTAPSDPSTVDTAAGFTYAFDCGSGYGSFTSTSTASCATTDNGTVTVKAKIKDKDGDSTEYTQSVTVNNVAPTATLNAPASVNEGSSIALSLTGASDPSSADTAAGFTYAFDCGDGGYGAFGTASTASCATTDNGSRTVKGKIKDKDGGVSEYTLPVTITNVAPTATFSAPASVNEGSAIGLSLTSPSDASSADTAAGFTYAFDCGDGSGYGAFSGTSTASCPTTDDGSRTVKGKIKDKDGGFSEYTAAVTINNVAPTGTIASSWSGVSGQPISIYFTAATDASVVDAGSLRYGFGCTAAITPTYATAATVSSTTCTYSTGDYTAHAYVIDKDGGYTDYPLTVHVVNPPPTVTFSASNTTSINEGSSTTTQYLYNYTTANATSVGTPSCGSRGTLVSGSATYTAPNGSFKCTFNTADGTATTISTVSITATGTGGSTTGTQNVQIANVAPTVTITSPLNFSSYLVGSPVNFVATFRDVGTSDGPWTCQWNFGNGITRTVTPAGTAQPYSCNTSYQYPAKGTFTATLTVTDKDGGVGTKSVTVIVS